MSTISYAPKVAKALIPRGRVYVTHEDDDDGSKTFHVCDGGQTIALVCEDLFSDRNDARRHANMIAACINAALEVAERRDELKEQSK